MALQAIENARRSSSANVSVGEHGFVLAQQPHQQGHPISAEADQRCDSDRRRRSDKQKNANRPAE
jgi:hypothetical protein